MKKIDVFNNFEIGMYKLINFVNLNKDEIDVVRNWRNNEKIRLWMYNDDIITEEEHINFINSLKSDNTKLYFLVKKEEEKLGVLYFTNINYKHRRAYFGIYSNPDEKKLRIGKILIKLVISIAFEVINFHTLKLEVLETNKRALNLYKSFKFKQEGILKDYVFKNGKWLNVIIMGMINPKERNKNENSKL